MTNPATPPLDKLSLTNPISRVRRNHGLEHATLHILSEKFPYARLAGYSSPSGFWIVGEVDIEELRQGVMEALQRLRNGERDLAVHPNCGTNFVTTGAITGLVAALTMLGGGNRKRDRLERIPLAISLSIVTLILSQPLGLWLQKEVTTSGVPESLEIVDIRPSQRGRIKSHYVQTTG